MWHSTESSWLLVAAMVLAGLTTGCGDDDEPALSHAELTIVQQPLYPAELVDGELIVVVGTSPIVEIRVFDETGAERKEDTAGWTSQGPAKIERLATEVAAGKQGLPGQFVVAGLQVGGTQLEGPEDLLVNVEVREQVWPPEEAPQSGE